ncbi:unnamed protein product [Urochloa decumbens]|uniref:Uncharacterized protein n=1 Tax=Urochloa decumbens TaxID=240449 RepID=A0ABC9B195_9POAL
MASLKKQATDVVMLLALVVAVALSSCHAAIAIQTAICWPDPDCETAGCKIQCHLPRVQYCRSDGPRMYCCCGDGGSSPLKHGAMVNSSSHE